MMYSPILFSRSAPKKCRRSSRFVRVEENQYELDIHSDSEIPHLVRQIVEGGGDVYDVTAQKPSLEDK